jgi:hypothetical protein
MFLKVAIILRYRGCGVWVLAAFWGTLFQLAVSPLNWIDQVMEEVGEKVGKMLSEEASIDKNMKETGEETTIEGLTKKYPGWKPTAHRGVESVDAPSEKM